jgi:hypothetical protein
MYTATVLVQITTFNPIGSGNIVATLSPPTDTSPGAPTGVFSGSGEQLIVVTPQGYTGGVQVTFQLPDPNYVLVGITARPNQSSSGAARLEFCTITVNRSPDSSQLTVTDACLPQFYNVDFEYLLVVQQLSSNQLGTIDPDEENEPQ